MAREVTVKLKGLEKMLASKESAVNGRRDLAIQRMNEGAAAIHRTALTSMRDTKRQSTAKPPKGHRASVAGSAPAPDTGNLLKSTRLTVSTGKVIDSGKGIDAKSIARSTKTARPSAKVISNATSEDGFAYSVALEFGTTTVAARPFMHPAYVKHKKKIQQLIKRAIIKGV